MLQTKIDCVRIAAIMLITGACCLMAGAESIAFQSGAGGFPSRLENAVQSSRNPIANPLQPTRRPSSPIRAVQELRPENLSTGNDDASWFGTVMTFPATPDQKPSNPFRLTAARSAGDLNQKRNPATSPSSDANLIRNEIRMQPPESNPFVQSHFNPPAHSMRPGQFAGNPIATQSQNYQSVLARETDLTCGLTGPSELNSGQTADYKIEIKNSSNKIASNIIVQLKLPAGLMITNLDRQAWIDEESRTVSWKLESMAPGASESIPYQVKILGTEDQSQTITVAMSDMLQGVVQMTIRVAPAKMAEKSVLEIR